MKKQFILTLLCALSMAMAQAADGTYTFGTNGSVTMSGTTATFTSLSAGDLAQLNLSWNGTGANSASNWNTITKFVFEDGCVMNAEGDLTVLTNAKNSNIIKVAGWNFYADDDMPVDVIKAIASSTVCKGVVFPLNSTVSDADLDAFSITGQTTLKYLVRITEGGTKAYYCYYRAADAMADAGSYMYGATDLTINAEGSTTQASNFSTYTNQGTVKKMTVKNGYIQGDISFSSKVVESVTLSNIAILDANSGPGTLTFTNCEGLSEIRLINKTWMDSLAINNCDALDHIDLKAAALVRADLRYNKLKQEGGHTAMNGGLSITNNAKLRYIILPHNYENATSVNTTTLAGNTNLHAVIATAYLSEKVYDANGNVYKKGNGQDSTRYVTDENGKNVLTAVYNIYKGGIPDDMMAIAQSMTYDYCTVHCRKPIEGSGVETAVDLYDASGQYVKTLDFGIAPLSTQALDRQSESDVAGMNKFNTRVFDISRTVYDHPAEVVADNDFVKYIILPDNMDAVLTQSVKSGEQYKTLESRVELCDALVAAVSYCGDPDMGNGNSDSITTIKGIMIAQHEPGHVAEILDIKYHLWTDIVTAHQFYDPTIVTNLVLVGNYNTADICMMKNYAACIGADGHYVGAGLDAADQLPADKRGFKNWNNTAPLKRIDLTRALFPTNNDMRLGQFLVAAPEKLYLPIAAEQSEMPDSCMLGSTMQHLCIPGNIKRIGNYALWGNSNAGGTDYLHVYTTAIDDKGNGYPVREEDTKYNAEYIIDQWEYADSAWASYGLDDIKTRGGAITISENVTHIGQHAFAGTYIKDVYAMGKTAPTCSFNAFSSVSYTANNSGPSSITNGVSRDLYHVSHGWMTYLHYPEDCDDTNRKRYTDPTRRYTLPDANGETDGDGNLVRWPSFLDWNRAFAQACAGITWNYWKDAADGEEWAPQWGTTSGPYSGIASYTNWQAEPWNGDQLLASYYGTGATYNNWVDEEDATYLANFGQATNDDVVNSDYMGWHQFVLAYTQDYDHDDPQWDVTRIKDNDWYTICVPFDLTITQLREAFGPGVQLHALYGVKRDDVKEQIVLKFTKDLVAASQRWKFEDNGDYIIANRDDHLETITDDDAIMQSGYPYLIRPNMPQALLDSLSDGTLKRRTISYKHATKGTTYAYPVVPYVDYRVTATDADGNICTYVDSLGAKRNYTYTFVGRYDDDGLIPMYAYYLAHTAKKPQHKWYRKTSARDVAWKSGIAIIGPNWDVKVVDKTVTFSSNDQRITYQEMFTPVSSINDDLEAWKTGQAARAFSMSFESDEDDTQATGITEFTTTGDEEALPETGTIYTLGGQPVSGTALSKGIYIKNGKKFIVK